MTVREFLHNYPNIDNVRQINVYQEPIKEIDSCPALVHRYTGEVGVALNSNQNYLNFEQVYYIHEDTLGFIIICRANEEQKQAIIKSYLS